MAGIGGATERISTWWKDANASQRALAGGGVAASLVAIIVAVALSSQPDFVVLFSGLDPTDASAVVSDLEETGVPYRVSRAGGTILVPSDQVGEMRLRAAGKGLTGSKAVGYEIFDKANLGMTEFLQHVNYRRALEGELTRTIVSMNEVKSARVHLAVPERSVFQREQDQPTASVVVELAPGGRLSDEQVRGIHALISASVEGLDASGVTVVDSSGRQLGGGSGSSEFAASSDQLRIQQEVEEYLRQKALTMLEQVVGPGQASVQINAELSFERVERSSETYNPASSAIRSEQRVAGEGTGGDTQETVLTNYEIDKTVESILGTVGAVKRLSVAVLVNGTQSTDASGATSFQERSAGEIATLKAMVQDAVGYDQNRGDSLEIASMQFADRGEELSTSPMPWWLLFPSMGSLLRSIVILAAIGLVAWGLRQSSTILVQAVEADRKRRDNVLAKETTESDSELRKEVIREEMNALALERPSEVAQVLRSWLVEEKVS